MKVKLSQAFDLQMGKTPSRNIAEYWDGNHKWVSIADIGNAGKYISATKECITDDGVSGSGIKVVPKGTVIMSFKLSIGKTTITSEDMYTNEAIMAFIDKGIYPVDPNYLYHLCCGTDWTAGTNKAVMGLTLNKATLSEKMINLPSVEEQKDIAEKLDEVDSLINIQQRQLAKLDELVKSQFVEMFGDVVKNTKQWPVHRLEEIATSRLGKMLDAKKKTGLHLFPYLANTNVQWFRFDLCDLRQMDFPPEDQVEFELQNGDLMVCEGGEVGRCAVWHNEITPCYFQKAIHRVRCNRDIVLPEYLAYWFKRRSEYNAFEDVVGSITTIAHLPGVKLKSLNVVVPPVELQKQFVSIMAQTDKSKLVVQQSLKKLETLKKSLMQQYFG